MIKKEDIFKIGHFAKPHGIKGEINLVTSSDVFEESDDPYIICEIDGILVPFYIEEFRYKSDSVVLVKLENIDSEERVREFVNLDVYYLLELMNDEDLIGDMTWDSFVGYTVSDKTYGMLGEIINVDESTINVLLQINYKDKDLLIPAVDELIQSVDHIQKHLEVSLPEGLLDL